LEHLRNGSGGLVNSFTCFDHDNVNLPLRKQQGGKETNGACADYRY
jgi:hypothetical protein